VGAWKKLADDRLGVRGTSQHSFAVEISLAARQIARVIPVSIELQNEKRRLRNIAQKILDERIGTALEIRNVNDVKVRFLLREASRRQDAPPRVPKHVGVQVVDGLTV
jgi:hypothetical protein